MQKKIDDNSSEEEIGRAEKIHIYVSGILWLVIILLVAGVFIYGGVMLQLRD